MKANGVKSENQVAVLLTAIGPETYGLLRNLLTPEKPDARSYEELVEILNSHLHPKPLVIVLISIIVLGTAGLKHRSQVSSGHRSGHRSG